MGRCRREQRLEVTRRRALERLATPRLLVTRGLLYASRALKPLEHRTRALLKLLL